MAMDKYRVHEVAKDFGLPTREITDILTKYATTPKNHMQALTDKELSLVFDCLTQRHPVSGIQVIFADTYKEPEQPKAAQGTPAQPKAAPQQQAQSQRQPQGQQGQRPQQQARPQNGQQNRPQQAQQRPQGQQQTQPMQQPVSRVPQKKVVDTRKGGDVNLAKYDERLEALGGERGERMQQRGGKEKFRSNNQRRGNAPFSNKRRQDEQE